MNTKTSIKQASTSTTREIVAAAKKVPVDSTVSMGAEGQILVDGEPSSIKELKGIEALLAETGSVTGAALRLMAIERFTPTEGARVPCVVVKNLNGRKKVFTKDGFRMIDRLSQDLVEVGGVYEASVNNAGYALINPSSEKELKTGPEVNPIFGGVPKFVFESVWQRIRGMEAEAQEQSRAIAAQEEVDNRLSALGNGEKITLG